jgi:tRNA(Ile)-lysidine synthase
MTQRSRPSRPVRLASRLIAHLDRTGLLSPDSPVVVALSGGLDSVVLLHLLRFPARERVGPVTAAHLDHAMRPDSEADARWVAGLCRAWDVPLVSARMETPPASEAAARHARYAFLEEAAAAVGAGARIATAHHADDQAETVLFRLARGTGVRGLRGIAPRRGHIVRPLLHFTRSELEAYAAAAGLAYRADPTNAELRFARNRIRHRVLPELERARPGATRSLAALADDARRVEAAWQDVVEAAARNVVVATEAGSPGGALLAGDRFLAYHPHLRVRLLRYLLRRHGAVPGRAGTRAALEFITSGRSGAALDLPGGVRLERDFDRVRITGPAPTPPDVPLEITGPEAGAGRAWVAGRELRVEWRGSAGADGEVVEAGVVVPEPRFPLTVRGRRAGDRIRLGYGTKKLKKLLAERRLDRHARSRVPVLVDGAGTVLWVVGVARAKGVGAAGDGLHIAVRDAEQR